MTETNSMSKMAGYVAHLVAIAGLAAFFFGLFGFGIKVMIAGIALIVVSLAAYYIEELGQRKQS